MSSRRVISVLLLGILLLSVLGPISMAFNDPPSGGGTVNGDWYVSDTRSYTGVTINMVGNLIINSTGVLTLNNVFLRINSTLATTYRIEVRAGGQLYTQNNTRITAGTAYNYRFLIQSGSTAQLANTNITRCGVMGGNSGNGIYIASDNVVIQNCNIDNGYKGICIEYASPQILNCTIRNHGYDGIYAVSSFPTIDGCNITRNGLTGGGGYAGVSVENSNSTTSVCRISNCTFRDNNLGVYFSLDSPGILENCTVTNSSFFGVRCFRSSPVIRQNNISKNLQHGIYMDESSPLVANNTVNSNGNGASLSSGMYILTNGKPVIRGNNVSSNTDTGINIRAGCAPLVVNNTVNFNTDKGIRFYYSGNALVAGNSISFNYDGMMAQGAMPVIAQNRIIGNQNDGLSCDNSAITFEDNNVSGTAMSGIHASNGAILVVGNCTFTGHNQYGISVDSNSYVSLVNGNFTDNFNKAFQCDAAGTLDWMVDRTAYIDGDFATIRGNISVVAGGFLTLSLAHLDINSGGIRRSLDVSAGGRLDIEGCNITAYNPADNYKFASRGFLDIRNSTIEEAGWTMGGAGDSGGLFIGGGFASITGSALSRNFCGLVLRSASARMEGSDIIDSETCAVDAQGSVLTDVNGTITGPSQDILRLDSASRLEMVGTTFDQARVVFQDGASVLNVSWWFSVTVQWASAAPIAGAAVNLSTSQGMRIFSCITDSSGKIPSQPVMQYSQVRAVKSAYTPHQVNVTKVALSNVQQLTIDRNIGHVFTLSDPTLPSVAISSPVDPSYIASHTVEICGTALDPETGIAKVEVSWNNATWYQAFTSDGYARWNYTFQLIEAAYTMTARAYNTCGNVSAASVHIRVMVSAPYLAVDYPKEGLLTNQSNITLLGLASMGANITASISGGPDIQVVNNNGSFSAPLQLNEGHNLVTVTARDAAGNTNSTTRNVTLDSIAPWIKLELPRVSYSSQLASEVNGTTDADELTINGMLVNISGGSFSRSVTLSTGAGVTNTSIDVVARDIAGNINRTTVYVLRDLTPPDIRLLAPSKEVTLTTQAPINFTGTTEAGAVLTIDDAPVQLDAGGNFSVMVELSEGTNIIVLKAVDLAGNFKIVRRTVQLDTMPPPLTVTAPIDGLRTVNDSVDLLGATEQGAKVLVNGEEVQVGPDGNFSKGGMTLVLGTNNITVSARDQAGNIQNISLKVTRDEPPIIPPVNVTPGPEKGLFEMGIPFYLLLAIVLGGAGAAGWVVAAGRRDRRMAEREASRPKGARPSKKMLSPTEMDLARKEGYRPADRPRTAEEMYGDDYKRWASGSRQSAVGSREPGVGAYYTPPMEAAAPPVRHHRTAQPERAGPPPAKELNWEKVENERVPGAGGRVPGETDGVQDAGVSWAADGNIPEGDFEQATGVDVGGGEAPAPTASQQPDAGTKKVDSDIDDLLKRIGEASKKK
jgi:parallel beta-helix repeat protein